MPKTTAKGAASPDTKKVDYKHRFGRTPGADTEMFSLDGNALRYWRKKIESLPIMDIRKVKKLRKLAGGGKLNFDAETVAEKFLRLERLLKS